MRARSAFLIALGVLAVAPAAAPAAAVPAPTPGVTARQVGDVVTFTFDAAAIAAAHVRTGDRLGASCATVPDTSTVLAAGNGRDPSLGAGGAKLRADGMLVVDLDAAAGRGDPPLGVLDVCQVDRFDPQGGTTVEVAKIALTPRGAARFEDDAAAVTLKAALLRAQTPSGGYRPAAAVPGVVALASADASPTAPGQLGYWTDGRRAIAVTITPSLRRLFVADDGGQTARFNLSQDTDTLFYSALDDVVEAASGGSGKKDPEADDGRPRYDASADPQRRAGGIRLARSGRRVTVRFTGASAKAYKKIAGRKVRLSCVTPLPERTFMPRLTAATLPRVATAVVRVPRHGATVGTTLSRAPGSVCEVWDDGVLVVLDGLGVAGRRWMQDQDVLNLLVAAGGDELLRPAAPGGRAYRSAAQIAAQAPKVAVALSGPDAAPPVGKLGVWSDGAQRYEVVAVSATGRRYFLADEGGGVFASNVLAASVAQTATLFAGLVG